MLKIINGETDLRGKVLSWVPLWVVIYSVLPSGSGLTVQFFFPFFFKVCDVVKAMFSFFNFVLLAKIGDDPQENLADIFVYK
jgi:hypothetical protein